MSDLMRFFEAAGRFGVALSQISARHRQVVYDREYNNAVMALEDATAEFYTQSVMQYNGSLDTDNDPGMYYEKLPSYYEQELRNTWEALQPTFTNEEARQAAEEFYRSYQTGQGLKVAEIALQKSHGIAAIDYGIQLESAVNRGDLNGVRHLTETIDPAVVDPAQAKQDQVKAIYGVHLTQLRNRLAGIDPDEAIGWLKTATAEDLSWTDFDGNTQTLTEQDRAGLLTIQEYRRQEKVRQLGELRKQSLIDVYTRIEKEDPELLKNPEFLKDNKRFPGLTPGDMQTFHGMIKAKNTEREQEANKPKEDLFADVEAALELGDFETAIQQIAAALDSGYISAEDEDIKRLQYVVGRMAEMEEQKQQAMDEQVRFDAEKEANKSRIEMLLLGKRFGAAAEAVTAYEQTYRGLEDTQDFVSHVREQLDQAEQRAAAQREKDQAYWAQTHTGPEYIREYSERLTDAETVEDLDRLLTWVRDNSLPTEADPFTPRIGTDKKLGWEKQIEAKRNKFQTPEYKKRQAAEQRGEQKLRVWFEKELEDAGQEYKQELLTELDKLIREYEARVEDVEDPAAFADYLLNPEKKKKVREVIREAPAQGGRMTVPITRAREETPEEYYTRIGLPELISPTRGTKATEAAVAAAQGYAEARRREPAEGTPAAIDWTVYRTRPDGSVELFRTEENGQEIFWAYNNETGEWESVDVQALREYAIRRARGTE